MLLAYNSRYYIFQQHNNIATAINNKEYPFKKSSITRAYRNHIADFSYLINSTISTIDCHNSSLLFTVFFKKHNQKNLFSIDHNPIKDRNKC